MIPLLAEADTVPYGQVATIVGALVAAIGALCTVIFVLWRRDVAREKAALDREKEIGTLMRSDGVTTTGALVTTTTAMKDLVAKIEQSDDQRAAIGSEVRAAVTALSEKLDDVIRTVERCNR